MARNYKKNVQENALNFLQVYYQKRFETSPVFSQKCVKTTNGHKLGGLVACQNPTQGIFTASMEVRSLTSIHKSFPFFGDKRWLLKNMLVAGMLAAGTFAAITFFPQFKEHAGFAAIMLMVTYLMYNLVTGTHKRSSERRLVEHIKQTPANEKWLILEINSDVMALHAKIDILRHQCEKRGIGILSVSKGRKVSIVQLPKESLSIQRNYLSYYSIEKEVRHFLTTQPAFVPAAMPMPAGATLSPIPVFVKAS